MRIRATTEADIVRQAIEDGDDEALRFIAGSRYTVVDRYHTPEEAAARILELREGNPLSEGMTIRDMIDEGRG